MSDYIYNLVIIVPISMCGTLNTAMYNKFPNIGSNFFRGNCVPAGSEPGTEATHSLCMTTITEAQRISIASTGLNVHPDIVWIRTDMDNVMLARNGNLAPEEQIVMTFKDLLEELDLQPCQ